MLRALVILLAAIPLVIAAGCSKDDRGAEVYFRIGEQWNSQDRTQEAIENLTKAIELDPNYAPAYLLRAANLRRQRKLAEARTDYETVLKLDPKSAPALSGRAGLNLEEGLYQQAKDDADAAIAIDDKLGEAYLQRGRASLRLGQHEAAIEDFITVSRLSRDRNETAAQAQAQLGRAYFQKGDLAEAIYNYSQALEYYDEQIRRFPKHEVVNLIDQTKSWEGKEKYDIAALIYARRAEAYLATGKVIEALDDTKKALRLNETLPEAHYQQARGLSRDNRFFEAKQALNEAIRLDPDRAEFYNLRGWISATCTQPQDRDGLNAVQDALRACEMTNYTRPDYIETLAAAYAEKGDFSSAVKWQQESIRLAGKEKATVRHSRLQEYENEKPHRGPVEL